MIGWKNIKVRRSRPCPHCGSNNTKRIFSANQYTARFDNKLEKSLCEDCGFPFNKHTIKEAAE
jgi:predicted Zn-ribbon and HTH transcriptional regulator